MIVHITAAHEDRISRAIVTSYTLLMMLHITAAHGVMILGAAVMSYTLP